MDTNQQPSRRKLILCYSVPVLIWLSVDVLFTSLGAITHQKELFWWVGVITFPVVALLILRIVGQIARKDIPVGNELCPPNRKAEQRTNLMFWGSLAGFLLLVISVITSQRLFLWLGMATWYASVLVAAGLKAMAMMQRKKQQAR